jgi:hypothetical protein
LIFEKFIERESKFEQLLNELNDDYILKEYNNDIQDFFANFLSVDLGKNTLNIDNGFQPMKREEENSYHWVYNVKLTIKEQKIDVYRRYSDFEWLYYALKSSSSCMGVRDLFLTLVNYSTNPRKKNSERC